jgi:hypothetical protein
MPASDSTRITVAVESAIHDALKEVVQNIADQHKIKVDSVSIKWSDISDHSGFKSIVREIEARTSKIY